MAECVQGERVGQGALAGDELAGLDALAQAELVRRGEVSARELVDAAVRRIERVDPALNSVPIPLFREAREGLESLPAGAPFAGVPFLLKDVGARQRGLPYFAGNRALARQGYRARRDSRLGARFRALGLATVGKSNTPEFGLQSTTQPFAFGPTRNPWDPRRSPGGSSGGACAAVAAGLVPVAHASDGAGPIRIPAAWCGLPGLKPSRGRVARDADAGSRSAVEFVVTRSLRDCATFLDLLAREPRAAGARLPAPADGFAAELLQPPPPLRIGLLAEMPGGALDPECAAAVEGLGRLLEACGHGVEPARPAALFQQEERALQGLVFAPLEHLGCLLELEHLLDRRVRERDVEPFLWQLAHLAEAPSPAEAYAEAQAWQGAWAKRLLAWWRRGFDLLLTPTVGLLPPLLDELDGRSVDPLVLVERMGPHMAFTEPFNVTGQPALTLPFHETRDGLPVGVQLVANLGREDLLLRVAAQIEQAAPWSGRRPLLHA
jgi:amidase